MTYTDHLIWAYAIRKLISQRIALLAVFDLKATYNRDKHQATIHATLTDATPQAVLDLLTDPRADHNRQPAPQPAFSPPKIMLPI